MDNFRSGFISLIGRSNVGKSTFLNRILARKISIVSPKPQTTRNRIRGIYTTKTEQMIFLDTPGIHKPKHKLGERMNEEAIGALRGVDLILYFVNGVTDFDSDDRFVIDKIKRSKTPCFLVINKIDLVKDKERLLKNVIAYTSVYDFEEVFYISAKTGTQIDLLTTKIKEFLPAGPLYYPPQVNGDVPVGDYPEEFIISEIIREKVLILTREEVPHSVAVFIEATEPDEKDPSLTVVNAVIVVERQSQKKILIGKNGSMIKEIGNLAKREIQAVIGTRILLELFVRVDENWRNRPSDLRRLGY